MGAAALTDIRPRLNARREALKNQLALAETYVDGGADPTSKAYEKSQRQIAELLEIESILAQMQNADAQYRLADAQREVADAQRQATAASERENASREGREFWLRRLFTSVAVGNGAGAFASVTALLRPEPPAVSSGLAALIVGSFVGGVALAGLIPLLLAVKPNLNFNAWPWPKSQWLSVVGTALAAMLFVTGCVAVVVVAFDTFERNGAIATSTTQTAKAPAKASGPPSFDSAPQQNQIGRP